MINQTTLFCIAFHLLSHASFGQNKEISDTATSKQDSSIRIKTIDVIVYELSISPYIKDGIFPTKRVEIKKHDTKPTFLRFFSGGSETNIRIIDSTYSRNNKNIWDTPPAKQLDFGYLESGLLDVSNLRKGTYFVFYMSCNISGNYVLTMTN